MVENYNTIWDHVKRLPDLEDYKEYEDEELNKIEDRILRDNLVTDNTVVFEGEGYLFFKWLSMKGYPIWRVPEVSCYGNWYVALTGSRTYVDASEDRGGSRPPPGVPPDRLATMRSTVGFNPI
ncbi:MAG: hypothetical protein LBJ31_01960 [Treponema sp.]|nr:hypothetical protein [Treponema sp.]